MDKKAFYLLVGLLITALVILIILVMALNSKKDNNNISQINEQTVPLEENQSVSLTDITEQPQTSPSQTVGESPEAAAESFYNWYTTFPNPLGSGEYLKNTYLSDEFKEIIQGFVNRGDHLNGDPVLTCVDITPPKKIIALPAEYDPSRLNAAVKLQEDLTGSTPLYKVILKNINQQWVVTDIRCAL